MQRRGWGFAQVTLAARLSARPLAALAAVVAMMAVAGALAGAHAIAAPPELSELVDQRTPTSKTFKHADGRLTTRLYSAPVHYRDGGSMKEIDPKLVRTGGIGTTAFPQPLGGYAYRSGDNAWHASFKDRPGAGFLRLEIGDRPVDVSLEGAAPALASARGNRVTYAGARPATDLAYDVSATSLKESITLRDASAEGTFRFSVQAPDGGRLTARRRPGGAYLFRTGGAGRGFTLAAPFATEAAPLDRKGDAVRYRRDRDPHAAMRVERQGDGFDVTVTVDEAWLQAPGRRFPVTVDPTITIQPNSLASEFMATCGTCEGSDYGYVWLGADDTDAYRGAFKFNLADIPAGAAISSASLGLYQHSDFCIYVTADCGASAHTLNLHRMTAAWTDTSRTSAVAFDPVVSSATTLAAHAPSGWMKWDVTTLTRNWSTGAQPNHGVLIKRATEPLGAGGPEVVGSSWSDEPAELLPKLEVTYASDQVRLLAPDTLHSDGADLRWEKWDGSTGAAFDRYEVHRSASAGFTPSASTLVATIRDASIVTYRDTTAAAGKTYTYKVVANGAASVAQTVTLPAAGQATTTLQPGFGDGQDTYLDGWSFDGTDCSNMGASTLMNVGADYDKYRSLVKFDLRSVPSGAKITSAQLSLYDAYPPYAAMTTAVHRVTAAWDEGSSAWGDCTGDGASWDEARGGLPWTKAGGDFDATALATVAKPAPVGSADPLPGWDRFAVTSAVQKWVDGTAPNHGLLLKAVDESDGSGKYSEYVTSEGGPSPTLRPKLALTYEDGSKPTPPSVAIASPGSGGDMLSGTVNVAATAADDGRVEKVEFFVDGALKATSTAAPYEYAWATTTATNASHTLTAKAYDDAGQSTTSAATTVSVGNSNPPSTSVTSQANVYQDQVKIDGASVHWRLGETAGTAVADASGNGRGGTYSGTYLLGQAGLLTNNTDKAALLRSATADGTVTGSIGAILSGSITAEAWASTAGVTTLSATNDVISRGWGSAGGWRLAFFKTAAGVQQAVFAINNAGTVSTAAATVSAGKHHLAGSYDGTTARLYVDGAQAATAATGAVTLNTTAPVLAGGTIDTDTTIDEVALYAKALTAAQVLSHADVGAGRPGKVSADVPVTASASDDGTVSKVEFYVDGVRFADDTAAPYAATLKTQDVDEPVYDGSRAITTKAYDNHGKVKESAPVTVEVDNAAANRYQATFSAVTPVPQAVVYDPAATAQDKHGVQVKITNTSTQAWSATDIVARYRWVSPDTGVDRTVTAGPELPLGAALAPNGSATVTFMVEPPALAAGVDKARYKLQLDVYEKSTGKFFAEKGNQPLENPVIVNKALLTALGLEKYYQYEGEELGAGMQHLVNVANGNSIVRWTPFSSPGRGLSTVVDLTYNGLEKKSESPVGNNFSISMSGISRLGNPIDIHPNKADEIGGRANKFVDLTDADGTTHRFIGKQAADGSTYWEEPDGVHLYLRSLGTADPARRWAFTRPDRTTFYYDADGFPTSVEDANGNRITYTVVDTPPGEDPGGPKKRVTKVTDAGGRSFDIAYYSKDDAKKPQIRGKIRRITDHTGSALDFEYYEDGNLLRIIQRGGLTAEGDFLADRTFVFTYTVSNGTGPALPAAADRVNPDTKIGNQSTRIYSIRDPRGQESLFSYLGNGTGNDRWKLASRTDRSNAVTNYAYDTTTRVTTVTQPLSRVSKYAYDVEGKVTKITNPKGEDTQVQWTGDRMVQKVIDPTPTGTTYREFNYDANGYLTERWDQERNYTKLVYDAIGVDADDVAGKWKTGRTIAHISQLKTKTDPNGAANVWQFAYDPRGNLTKVTDPENFFTEAVYNADGTVATSYDANRNPTSYTYDANGLAATETDAENRVTRFQHDADGLLQWIQDALHQNSTGADPRLYRSMFYYDAFQRMGRQSAPKGTVAVPGTLIHSAARFDANDNVVGQVQQHYGGVTYPRAGAVSTNRYDAMDRRVEQANADTRLDPKGERTQYDYDAAGRVTRITSPKGVLSTGTDKDFAVDFDYDPLDRVIRQTRYEVDGANAVSRTLVTHTCFDKAGDKVSVTYPRAGLSTVDCSSATTPFTKRYAYTVSHRLKSETDQSGNKKSIDYDPNGNRIKLTDARDQITEFRYNKRNEMIRQISPLEDGATGRKITTAKEYDAAGNLIRDISGRAWDAAPNLSSYAGKDFVTGYSYDRTDRMTKMSLPTKGGANPTFVHRAYDPNGNLTTTSIPTAATTMPTDAKQKTTVEYFDPGWIKSSRDPGENEVNFDYTAEGWQSKRAPEKTDGTVNDKRVSTWEYWPDGTKKAHHGRDGGVTDYFYDANNNIEAADDASGATKDKETPVDLRVAYDGLDRVSKVRMRKQGESAWRVATSAYDPDGNVSQRVDDRREDDAGAVVGGESGRTHKFAYFANGWLDEQLDSGRKPGTAADDRRTEVDYLPTGWEERRLVQKSNGAGGYDTKQTLTWTYYANGQKRKTLVKNKSDAVMESHDLEYVADNTYLNGNKTKDTFFRKSPKAGTQCQSSTAPCVDTFTYDARDRLTKETRTRSGTEVRETSYELYDHGAIKKETGPQGTITYDYDGTRMKSVSGAGGTNYYHYDDDGNQDCVTFNVSKPSACASATTGSPDSSLVEDYQHDELNRMTRYESFGTKKKTSNYVYDALDRLVEQVDNPGASEATTKFSHRGVSNQVTQEEKSFKETGKATKTKSFAYDASGHRIGMSYERGSVAKDYTYSEDSQGSVTMLIDDAGEAKASYGYTAYGESDDSLTAETDPDKTDGSAPSEGEETNPFRYTGKRQDSGSNTLDMGSRRFSPNVASFTEPDLYENAFDNLDLAQDPLTSNRYSLAGGNPVSFVEVDGHWPGFVEDAADTVEESAGDIGGALKDTGESALKEVKGTAEWAYNSANFTNGEKFKETWSKTSDTAEAIAKDPGQAGKNVVNSFVNPIKESYKKGGLDAAITRGLGEGAVAVVGGKGLTKLGRLGRAGRSGGKGRPSCNSFVAGTPVRLASGAALGIEQVRLGDVVLGTDEETGETRGFEVTRLIRGKGTKHLVALTIDGETLVATDAHPVFLADEGRWVLAGDLRGGDVVRRADGTAAVVEVVRRFTVPQLRVFNLTVEQAHTYYAGESPVLVHNGSDDCVSGTGDLPEEPHPDAGLYKRPSHATTPEQRQYVQGKPCADCGEITPNQRADHIEPLVVEHYRTGRIDTQKMRKKESVQAQCPTCSARQGGILRQFSMKMRQLLRW